MDVAMLNRKILGVDFLNIKTSKMKKRYGN